MASSDNVLSEPTVKKCKYCKNNVDKICVKCINCAVNYHQSCALRITGLLVASGSKGLIQCPTCAKNARESEVQSQIKQAMTEKEVELESLKHRISELEENSRENAWEKVSESIQSIEKNLDKKLVSLIKNVNKITSKMEQSQAVLPTADAIAKEQTLEHPKTTPSNPDQSNQNEKSRPYSDVLKPKNPHRNRKESYIDTAQNIDSNQQKEALTDPKDPAPEQETQPTSLVTDDFEVNKNPEQKHGENENDEGENNEWKTFHGKKHKQRKDAGLRPAPVKGRNDGISELKAAEKIEYSWLFLSRLTTSTTPQQIVSYLGKNGVRQPICELLRTKNEKRYSSFKIGV